jgi:hypothetical protein
MNEDKVKRYEKVISMILATHPDTKDLQGPVRDEAEWKQALKNVRKE